MIRNLIIFFTDTLFRKKFKAEWMNKAARQYRLFFYTARGLQEHGTMVRCAALTFYTLSSIVPILAVVFAILKGFGLLDMLIDTLYGLFPQIPDIVDYIVEFADKALANTHSGVVAAVGVVMLFWAVIRVFGSIENAFNHIWEVTSSRSIASKYPVYISVVVAVPLLWAAVSGAAAWLREALWFDSLAIGIASHVVSLVVAWLVFALLYFIIPNTTVRFGSALTAGIVAGTAFMLFQWGYVYVQLWMTSYNAIYGSFVALPLLLVWMQTSWQILLFGGELSFAYQNISRFAEERESLLVSYDQRRKILLAVLVLVVRRFRDEGGVCPADFIRERLALPTRIVNDVLFQLVQAGQLIAVRIGDDEREMGYSPAHDITQLTVCSVLEAVEGDGQMHFDLDATPDLSRVDSQLERLKTVARGAPENLRLTELL